MLTTRRQYFLEDLRSIIQALASVAKAEINSTRALHTIDPSHWPYVNITPTNGALLPEKSGIGGVETWELKISITIFTKTGNVEDIRGYIKEAIYTDLTRDGNADDTTYTGDGIIVDAEIASGTQAIGMEVTVIYHTEEGKKI